MILPNGNLFVTDVTIRQGLKAIEIVKQKLNCAVLGVEFERDKDLVDANKPIVSCMVHNVEGTHLYQVDVVDKTIKLYK